MNLYYYIFLHLTLDLQFKSGLIYNIAFYLFIDVIVILLLIILPTDDKIKLHIWESSQMVNQVKQDGKVSLKYMKIFEQEEMLIEQGRNEERKNTERERKRADLAEKEILRLEEQIRLLQTASRTSVDFSTKRFTASLLLVYIVKII